MMLLSISDLQIWTLAGVSILVVFSILIILVGVLYVFSVLAKKENQASKPEAIAEAPSDATGNDQLDQAAVAMALGLYLIEKENSESHVLTITPTPDSAWGAQLNPRF